MNVRKWAGRFGAVWGLVLVGLFLAGCQTNSSPPGTQFSDVPGGPVPVAGNTGGSETQRNAGGSSVTPVVAYNPNNYLLRAGDLLTIKLDDLPNGAGVGAIDSRIREDGTITLILNETFDAVGKTVRQLEKEIRERYVPKKFKYMTVTVNWQSGSRFYYVGGEVKNPGNRPYIARIRILEAIQSAGDFNEYAKRSGVLLTRANGQKIKVNCKKAKTHPDLNIEVLPDDRIDVPKSFW